MSRHAAKAPFNRRDDDPADGWWITDDDLKESADAVYDDLEPLLPPDDAEAGAVLLYDGNGPVWSSEVKQAFGAVREVVGDVSLLTHTADHADDLVHVIAALQGRIAALEATGGGGVEPVTAEGTLEVDNYGGGFIRVRDTGNILGDGQEHWVDFDLATVAGPGGEVIDPVAGVPAGTGGTWFDNNGNLGNVVGPTGTAVNQTTLRNWVKYGHGATGSHYVLLVHTDLTGEHPQLVVDQIVNVS